MKFFEDVKGGGHFRTQSPIVLSLIGVTRSRLSSHVEIFSFTMGEQKSVQEKISSQLPRKTSEAKVETAAAGKVQARFKLSMAVKYALAGCLAAILLWMWTDKEVVRRSIAQQFHRLAHGLDSQLEDKPRQDFASQPQQQRHHSSQPFNADDFLSNYRCDPNYGYVVRMLTRDPLLMQIQDFLSQHESKYLIELG